MVFDTKFCALPGSDRGLLMRGLPELLRLSSRPPPGDSVGEAALEGTCVVSVSECQLCHFICFELACQ